MIEKASQRVELAVPETLVMRDPLRGLLHGRRFQRAAHHPAFLGARDQAGRFQHRQVLHKAGQRHGVRLREFGHAARALVQLRQHAAARGVGQRGEDQIELGVVILNHLV